MIFLRKLIVIISLISYSCASTSKSYKPELTVKTTENDIISGIKEIDPNDPPRDGVWMTWNDAYSLAKYQREQRISCDLKSSELEKDNEICASKLSRANNALNSQDGSIKKWFNTWGFPLGIIVGGIIGAVVPIAIGAHR